MAVQESKIVCLDESTASLDLDSDRKITELLRTEFKHATVICIAHRISTISQMDKIFVLDQGRVVEEGSPEELLERKGVFAALAGSEAS